MRKLLLLLGEQVVRDHDDGGVPAHGGEQRRGAAHRRARVDVALLVRQRRADRLIVARIDARPGVQTAEPLDARRVEIPPPGHHLEVQRFEDARVRPLDVAGAELREALVSVANAEQRRARAATVIEQRVVQIEEDRSNLSHIPII